MPNGGTHHCAGCHHFVPNQGECQLRGVAIIATHWTTCRDWNQQVDEPHGPIFSIVCEVKNGAGGYGDIPWFDGCRVDTEQPGGTGDTLVAFTDSEGKRHEFPDARAYLDFWKMNATQK